MAGLVGPKYALLTIQLHAVDIQTPAIVSRVVADEIGLGESGGVESEKCECSSAEDVPCCLVETGCGADIRKAAYFCGINCTPYYSLAHKHNNIYTQKIKKLKK
jgi:hypothetical protein